MIHRDGRAKPHPCPEKLSAFAPVTPHPSPHGDPSPPLPISSPPTPYPTPQTFPTNPLDTPTHIPYITPVVTEPTSPFSPHEEAILFDTFALHGVSLPHLAQALNVPYLYNQDLLAWLNLPRTRALIEQLREAHALAASLRQARAQFAAVESLEHTCLYDPNLTNRRLAATKLLDRTRGQRATRPAAGRPRTQPDPHPAPAPQPAPTLPEQAAAPIDAPPAQPQRTDEPHPTSTAPEPHAPSVPSSEAPATPPEPDTAEPAAPSWPEAPPPEAPAPPTEPFATADILSGHPAHAPP